MSNRRPQEARRPWSWLIFDVGRKNMPETYAYFYVQWFDCDPSVISDHLSLAPTHTWRRGDPRRNRKNHFYDVSGWQVESGLPRDTYDMSAPVAALIDLLLARID